MRSANRFLPDMLDMDQPQAAGDVVWRAGRPTEAAQRGRSVILKVPFHAVKSGTFSVDDAKPAKVYDVVVRAYGPEVVRVSVAFDGSAVGDDGPMLELDKALAPQALKVRRTKVGFDIVDARGKLRMSVDNSDCERRPWDKTNNMVLPVPAFNAEVQPDGKTPVPFLTVDSFFPMHHESLPLAVVEREGRPHRAAFSLHAEADEKFAGTGERFARMNLAGSTLALENDDGLGVSSPRAYKNVPFYVSNRPYGLFIHTSAHVRLGLASVSTRAAQAAIQQPAIDLFFVGGGSLERILLNYRRLTGFPRNVPLWSLGMWMSRMSYFSSEEMDTVARKLREGRFPCDVLHADTAWFESNWNCDWEFGRHNFPEPQKWMARLREQGFRVSLWQMPSVGKNNKHFEICAKNGYIAPKQQAAKAGASNFGDIEYAGAIDFSNPRAVEWYKGLLEKLLRMGAVCIKTDFGEMIDLDSQYKMPAGLLHNLYALLYQKAAYEITEKVHGEAVLFARAGWAGCQRYPLHWGGDSSCTWDGLAASIRGGLHLGLSGFGFWTSDVPGFYALPDFMASWPEEDLYIRWTQAAVFSSHLRYHGTTPREMYEYPKAAPIVRKWLNLRYSLIPYLADQAKKVTRTGLPILRALALHHNDDATAWGVDDQFYCGDSLLVAPVMNGRGRRDVYLPAGTWTDFWSGEVIEGPAWIKDAQVPMQYAPVYARTGDTIRVYPHIVQSTNEMNLRRAVEMKFDRTYKGFSKSVLGKVIDL